MFINKKKSTKRDRISDKGLDFIVNSDKRDEQFDQDEQAMLKQHRAKIHERSLQDQQNTPWIEKYRPKTIGDVVIDKSTRQKIDRIIKTKSMPNIIITGIPGIGKTTTNNCIAKALLGKYYNQGVLELNASDERGIKSVQETIINFCKKKLDIEDRQDRTYAKHKIVQLDEADNMTKKAQNLINILMDEYYETTRFAFTCNNSSDIIEAIQSRCIILRYRRLDNDVVLERLKYICKLEKVNYTEDGLKAIILTSQGDMRKALNNLQLTHAGYDKVTPENVFKLCDRPHPLTIKKIFMACKNKDLKEALTHLQQLQNDGYCSSDISLSMVSTLKSQILQDDLDESTKIEYMTEIGKACLVITKGVNSPLQLTGCVAKLCM